MGEHGIEHDAKDNDAHNHTDPQTQVMQGLDALAHVGDAFT